LVSNNTDLFFYQDGERVVSSDYNITTPLQWWGSGQLDILLQVRELGTLTDRGYVKVLARRGQSSYDFFQSDLSSGGRQPLPLSAATDLNDADGFRQMVFTDSAGNWNVGDRIEHRRRHGHYDPWCYHAGHGNEPDYHCSVLPDR
jgi:hypothetical protein